jgi:hypothetical protein
VRDEVADLRFVVFGGMNGELDQLCADLEAAVTTGTVVAPVLRSIGRVVAEVPHLSADRLAAVGRRCTALFGAAGPVEGAEIGVFCAELVRHGAAWPMIAPSVLARAADALDWAAYVAARWAEVFPTEKPPDATNPSAAARLAAALAGGGADDRTTAFALGCWRAAGRWCVPVRSLLTVPEIRRTWPDLERVRAAAERLQNAGVDVTALLDALSGSDAPDVADVADVPEATRMTEKAATGDPPGGELARLCDKLVEDLADDDFTRVLEAASGITEAIPSAGPGERARVAARCNDLLPSLSMSTGQYVAMIGAALVAAGAPADLIGENIVIGTFVAASGALDAQHAWEAARPGQSPPDPMDAMSLPRLLAAIEDSERPAGETTDMVGSWYSVEGWATAAAVVLRSGAVRDSVDIEIRKGLLHLSRKLNCHRECLDPVADLIGCELSPLGEDQPAMRDGPGPAAPSGIGPSGAQYGIGIAGPDQPGPVTMLVHELETHIERAEPPEAVLSRIVEAMDDAAAEDLTIAAVRCAALLPDLGFSLGAQVAMHCWAMVEWGADPEAVADPIITKAAAAPEVAGLFLQTWTAATLGSDPPDPADDRFYAATIAALATVTTDEAMAVRLAEAWYSLGTWAIVMKTVLAAAPAAWAAQHGCGLLPTVTLLMPYRPDLGPLLEQLRAGGG